MTMPGETATFISSVSLPITPVCPSRSYTVADSMGVSGSSSLAKLRPVPRRPSARLRLSFRQLYAFPSAFSRSLITK
jgi:hypothetical protein